MNEIYDIEGIPKLISSHPMSTSTTGEDTE